MINYCKSLAFLMLFVQTLTAQNLSNYQIKSLTFSNDIPVKTTLSSTDNIIMEVQVLINTETVPSAKSLFEELYSAGRYNLIGSQANNDLFIGLPAAYEAITINGKEFLEDISIQVQLPKGATAATSSTVYTNNNRGRYGSQTATTASITRRPGLKRLIPPKTPNTQVVMQDQAYLSQNIVIIYTINGEEYKPANDVAISIETSDDAPAPKDDKQVPAKTKALEASPANTGKKKQR